MRDGQIKKLLEAVAEAQKLSEVHYDFASGMNKKDGFLSSMVHVKLTGLKSSSKERVTLNLILKFAPSSEKFRNQMPVKEAFRRETLFYDCTAPWMEQVLAKNDNKGRKTLEFVPKLYASSALEGHECLAMENLLSGGYELWNCREPMNDEHVHFVLKQYGQLHALGFALRKFEPQLYEERTRTLRRNLLDDDGSADFQDFLVKQTDVVGKGVQLLGDVEVEKRFAEHRKTVLQIIAGVDVNDRFNTPLHGDCWCNNMMFKYYNEEDKSRPSAVKLVDWQLHWHGPPSNDFSYFFYANASTEMYERIDSFKTVYYESLARNLVDLGLDPDAVFSRADFENQMRKHARFGITMAFSILYMRFFKDEIKDHEDLEGTDETLFDQFSAEHKDMTPYYEATNALILHAVKRGYM